MKRLGLVLLLVVALAPSAMAGPVWVGSYGPYQTGTGGEFTLQLPSGWLDLSGYGSAAGNVLVGTNMVGSFQTFCTEGNEYIYTNTLYSATIDPYAENGGAGAVGNRDTLSAGTGWLYRQFATGDWSATTAFALSAYNYGANRSASAGALQQALWWLEGGEQGTTVDYTNNFVRAVIANFGTWDNARADGADKFGVSAVNLTLQNGTFAQTQLHYSVPDGGTTLMLLGGALVGLGALRRRFSR